MQQGTAASVREVCSTLGVTRSRLYKKPRGGRPKYEDSAGEAEVVLALKDLAGRFPTYGYRGLKVLVSRQVGYPVNAKRIRRLMHEHGLVTARRVERARPRPHPRQDTAVARWGEKEGAFLWRQPDEEEEEMALLRYITEEEATGKVKEVFEDIKKTREIDHVTHPWRAMANFPDYLEMTWSRLKEIMKPGKVGALTKEIIALAVSITNGCRY